MFVLGIQANIPAKRYPTELANQTHRQGRSTYEKTL